MKARPEKSRILKVHIGHPANCSTGETAGALILGLGMPCGFYLTLLGAIILAAGRFRMVRRNLQEAGLSIKYWTIPQIVLLCLGVPLVIIAWRASGKNAALLTALGLGVILLLQALALGLGYIVIRRLRNPGWIAVVALLVPVILALLLFLLLRVIWRLSLREFLMFFEWPLHILWR